YFVTAGTYHKAHYFRTPQRLDVLARGLLTTVRNFSWRLEAWAVFSNHYHFVAHSPDDSESASSLSQMLAVLHTRKSRWVTHWTILRTGRFGTTSGIQSLLIRSHILHG